MDLNQLNILFCQCVVCGDEFVFDSLGTSTTPVDADKSRLFSIFLRCVSDSSDDEIDSSITSPASDLVSCESTDDDGLAFCSTCQSALIQWDKLYESRGVITQNLDRLKLTIYAKILNSSKSHEKDDNLGRKISEDHRVTRNQSLFLLLLQKIQQVKDQICRQFNPMVSLKRISSDQISESSKNFSGFDENEELFGTFKNEIMSPAAFVHFELGVHDDADDCEMASECSSGGGDDEVDDDWEINSDQCSIEDDATQLGKCFNLEANAGSEPRKANRKDAKSYETVSSGPNEWIYAGKCRITFNSEEQLYHCGLCSTVNSQKYGLMRHIRNMHIDGKRATKETKADMVRSSRTPQKHKAEILRATGDPNEYIYRDRFKVTCKDNKWCCGECGAQWKNRFALMTHIRSGHMHSRKKAGPRLRYEQISPNEFLCYGKYSFRFDSNQQLYLCSLCDYTSTFTTGVLAHIRGNHCTDAEKQEHRAVQVAPGEYLYGGKYKIVLAIRMMKI